MILIWKLSITLKNPDTSSLAKKTDYDTKLTELENKIADVSSLAIKTVLTAVENKIPSVSSLVKKNRLCHKNYWNWKESYWS